MSKKTYRLIALVDIEAESLEEAYWELYTMMDQATSLSGNSWESSDEWFGPDGEAGDPDELQKARMAFFDKTRKGD